MRTVLLTTLVLIAVSAQAAEQPWPAPVPGWKAPEPGEHPRLFFRKADLPAIKQRAQTPEGQLIVQRLKLLLNGSDGASMPANLNNSTESTDATRKSLTNPIGQDFTLWHGAGYGMLFQLTGEKKFADLAKQSVEAMLGGTRDRDGRYAYVNASGALRAGPVMGALAMAYDLAYDGWDPEFREKVAKALAVGTAGKQAYPLDGLVNGARLGVRSNHGGCQIGGGALAILALWKDPGVDNARIEKLMADSERVILKQFTEGFGDGGQFWEGKGAGGIASDTSLIPAIQAWRVAGGKDFVSPRPNVAAVTLLKVHELTLIKGEPWYLIDHPSGYGTGNFTPGGDRHGLSRAGQFAQGFGAVPDKMKPAMLWTFNNIVEKDPAKRTFDTVSPYPHRAVLALVNWPIGVKEVNPAELMPRVAVDNTMQCYSFRNQWTGTEDDIVVNLTAAARDGHEVMVFGKGERRNLMPCPKGRATHFQPAEDGSGTISISGVAFGIDFSKTSGADGLIVAAGMKGLKTDPAGMKSYTLGSNTVHVLALGKAAEAQVSGDKLVIGKQEISYDGQKITFGKMAGPPKLPRFGCW